MTRAEIRAEIVRRLEESSSTPVFYTTAQINAAIDTAYAEVSDETEWNERCLIVDLLDDRPWYDGRTVLGTSLLSLGPAFNVQTNRWLIPSAPHELSAVDVRWERQQTEPQRVLTRGLWWFGYWPRVQSDSGTVQQSFTALPDALDEDTDEPGFPDAFHYGLVEDALAELWSQDGESTLALQAWQAGRVYEDGLKAHVESRASVPMLRGFRG